MLGMLLFIIIAGAVFALLTYNKKRILMTRKLIFLFGKYSALYL